jgi:hypothetical protein
MWMMTFSPSTFSQRDEFQPSNKIQIRHLRRGMPNIKSVWIQAKVMFKSKLLPMKHKPGKYFWVIFKDRSGVEIEAKFFEAIADDCYDRLTLKKVYCCGRFYVKEANPTFAHAVNKFEIAFDAIPHLKEAPDDPKIQAFDDKTIPMICDIRKHPHESFIDVIAVIKEVPAIEIVECQWRNGLRRVKRRRVLLCDWSHVEIELTLWGKEAENFFPQQVGKVIRIKQAQVNIWCEKTWSLNPSKAIFDFDIVGRAEYLQNWWLTKGQQDFFEPIGSVAPTTTRLVSLNHQKISTPKRLSFYGLLVQIPIVSGRLLYYCTCSRMNCSQPKVIKNQRCSKCGEIADQPRERFVFPFRVTDFSGTGIALVLSDDEIGRTILGCDAHQWAEETQGKDVETIKHYVKKRQFTHFKFKVLVGTDEYRGPMQHTMVVVSVKPIDYGEGARFYASKIRKLTKSSKK